MEVDLRDLRYRITACTAGQRLTVYDRAEWAEREATLLEGLVFATPADALHFVGVHYPNASEDM